jgi:hypothetical protein
MDPHFRMFASDSYRRHTRSCVGDPVPDVATAAELIALAKRVTKPDFERTNGWRTDPPLPGFLEKPEQMAGGWRMIFATRMYEGAREAGVLFVTLMTGKPVAAFLAEPGTLIPEEYLPAASR